jgi:hypothetical protein
MAEAEAGHFATAGPGWYRVRVQTRAHYDPQRPPAQPITLENAPASLFQNPYVETLHPGLSRWWLCWWKPEPRIGASQSQLDW